MSDKELWSVARDAYHSPEYGTSTKVIWQHVVDAISAELLREDEPVAWIDDYLVIRRHKADKSCRPLYLRPAPKVPSGWQLVPKEPTEEMITAYLTANDSYWKDVDKLPPNPTKWRNGTPSQATSVSLRAAMLAAPKGETK